MKLSVLFGTWKPCPDLGGFAAAHDLVGRSDVEVREAIGDKFPKHVSTNTYCVHVIKKGRRLQSASYLPQSSSASRFTAGAAGFLEL